MVVRTRLAVTLYVRCLSCLQYDLCNGDLGQYDFVQPHVSLPQLSDGFSVNWLLQYVYHLHIVTPEHGIVTATVIRTPPHVHSQAVAYRRSSAYCTSPQICPSLNRNFVFQLSKFHSISLCPIPPPHLSEVTTAS
jgi:hypothetical protein